MTSTTSTPTQDSGSTSGPTDGVAGKVVAVTGASSGIGEAVARHLAARGAAVVLGARRADRLAAVVEAITAAGGRASAVAADVTVPEDLQRLVRAALDAHGRLDVVVANAGVAATAPLADLDTTSWAAMVDVNLRGVLHTVAAALPVFRAQGSGHLVVVASTSGLKVVPGQAVYAATKNAVRTLVEALRQESTDGALRTTTVSPGFVRTELVDATPDEGERARMQERMAELGLDPAAVARAVAFAVEQPADVEVGDLTVRPTRQG